MATTKKFGNVEVATAITDIDYFIGVRMLPDGSFKDYRYTPAQISALLRSYITVSVGGATLTNDFFSNTIQEIVMNNQVYMRGIDFTQSGTTITLADGMLFNAGQKICAKI